MRRSLRRAHVGALLGVMAMVLATLGVGTAGAAGTVDLQLSKSSSATRVSPGSGYYYELIAYNAGPDAATDVVVTDTLPAGVTYDSFSAYPETGTCSEAAGVVTCEVATLGAFEAAYFYLYVTSPSSSGTVTNNASVTSDGADTDTDLSNNEAEATTEVGGVDLFAQLSTSVTQVLRGDDFTYSAGAYNSGFESTSGSFAVDLPPGVTYNGLAVTAGSPSCSESGGTVTCSTGTLAPGESALIDIDVTAPTTTATLLASATVSAASDFESSNDLAEVTVDVVAGLPTAISNGVVSLGINPSGELNAAGVGLKYEPTGNDGIIPGCPCEGWGAADAVSQVTGYANQAAGSAGYQVEDFVVDADSAVSTVAIPSSAEPTMRVVHDYHPSANPNLYEATVTITNTSDAVIEPRYRRAMDWDIPPTTFSELVTIQGSDSAANVLYASDDGFATSDPLAGPSSILFEGDAVDSGPDDHGALFDFGFEPLDPAESITFKIYYGAADDEAEALADLASVEAEVYSLGQPSDEAGASTGAPNTFMFAFTGVGGPPVLGGNQVSIGDAQAYEGDVPKTRVVKFPVTLTEPATTTVTVDYVITPVTASGGKTGDINDKAGKTGKLTFKPSTKTGLTPVSKFVTVAINPDTLAEGDETFTVTLSNPTGGVTIGDGVGAGTVLDDDPGSGQRIGLGSASVHEGDEGKVKVAAIVTFAQPAVGGETFTISTGGGTAVAGVDYKLLSKTFVMKPGQRTKVISVLVYPNELAQGDRTIGLTLSGIAGASLIGSGTATLTILDDD